MKDKGIKLEETESSLTGTTTWSRVRVWKNPMNLYTCEIKECNHGEGSGVYCTLMSDCTTGNGSPRIRHMDEVEKKGSVEKKPMNLCPEGY